ncbi:MAG: TolC family protein, partial [Bacteroidetes bacterium]|nr:TolC family protein [Bacteroidota bacterium]
MLRKITLFFVGLMSFISVSGQQSLTLSEAIDRALRNNYQIKIAKANVEVAANNNTMGMAEMLPSLSYNLTNANSLNMVDNPASFLRGEYTLYSLRNNIDLNWTVFNGFRAWITKDMLAKLVEFSMGNSVVVVENTIQATVLSYNRVLLERERLEVFKNVLELSRSRYENVRERQKLGTAVTFDVLLVKNNMLSDSSALMLQQITYNNALRNLNLIMAEDVGVKFLPVDSLAPLAVIYDLENLKRKMLSNNTTLKNQFVNAEILRKESGIAQADLFPRINLNAGHNVSENWISHENFNGRGGARDYYGNFTLSFNLFNGGRVRNNIQNAKIQERIAQLNINEMEQSMLNQIIQLYELYVARTAILSISRENFQSAEINLNLAKERLWGGTITSFDYRDVQLNYMNAAQVYLSSVYDQIETHTELLRLTGG